MLLEDLAKENAEEISELWRAIEKLERSVAYLEAENVRLKRHPANRH